MGRRFAGSAQLSAERIVLADLDHPEVVALLDLHVRSAHENSPACHAFALDLDGIRDPAVTLWTIWEGERLLGLGALKQIAPDHGELKSMRTAPAALRRGVGGRMLAHLIAEAQRRGYRRLSLETGSNEAFAPARAMYEHAGFVECGPFADYDDTSFSRYYALTL